MPQYVIRSADGSLIIAVPPPAPKPQPPKLKDDETIINPFYMRQLFQHAIHVAQEGRREFTEEEEIEEATVNHYIYVNLPTKR